jgi:hypothetical protein
MMLSWLLPLFVVVVASVDAFVVDFDDFVVDNDVLVVVVTVVFVAGCCCYF